jgi:hypothetical protein
VEIFYPLSFTNYQHQKGSEMPFGTRNFLQVRVGKTHTIQVLIHVRLAHLNWYNQHEDEYTRQILKIISRRILPHECHEDIRPPSPSKKEDTTTTTKTTVASKKKGASKRKRKSEEKDTAKKDNFFKKTTKKPKQKKEKGKKAAANSQVQLKERKYLQSLDSRLLYGDDLQIIYKMEPIQTRHFACLSCVSQTSDMEQQQHQRQPQPQALHETTQTKSSPHVSKFQSLRMIPKQIVLWCFPFDPMNPSDPNLVLDGFVRPEMIPLSKLFSDTQV